MSAVVDIAACRGTVRSVAQDGPSSSGQLAQLVAGLGQLRPDEWSRCINSLCRKWGTRAVLERAFESQADFLERYIPDPGVFPVCRGAIRRIGVICHKGNGGGAERATMLWIDHMRCLGFHVVWMPDRTFEAGEKFALDSDRVKRSRQIWDCICSEHLDLVLLVDHWRMRVFHDFLIAKMAGARVVVAEHNAYFFPLDDVNPALYLARLHFYPMADAITVLSEENAAWWRSVGLKNAVPMPNFLTFGDDFKKRPPRLRPRGRFVCVGRICSRKNQCAVVSAFARYRVMEASPEDSRLVLLGRFESEETERSVRLLIEHFGLESSVVMPGEVSNVESYYQDADVLLMASRLEGAPMVINEAKSFGLPTVMYELPYVEGTRDDDGVMAVHMDDIQAMANAMHRCMVDEALYARLSAAALDSLKRYSAEVLETRWRRMFELLEGAGESRCAGLEELCQGVSESRMFQITMKAVGALVPALRIWKSAGDAVAEERDRAYAERDASYVACDHANSERDRAYAERDASYVACDHANSERDRAYAERDASYVACDHANSERDRAYAERDAAYVACDHANSERDRVYADKAAAWSAHDKVERERNEVWDRLDAERARLVTIARERDEARQLLASSERRSAELIQELEGIKACRSYRACQFLMSLWKRGQ